jgi:hypothetical protein
MYAFGMNGRHAFYGFLSGFAATIFFHQPALWLLHVAGVTSRGPYVMTPVPPLGVPATISLAFWGGVWGIILIAALGRMRRGFIPAAVVFGAVLPTIGAWLINNYVKHQPLPATGKNIVTGLTVNAAWGLGTALCFRLLARKR